MKPLLPPLWYGHIWPSQNLCTIISLVTINPTRHHAPHHQFSFHHSIPIESFSLFTLPCFSTLPSNHFSYHLATSCPIFMPHQTHYYFGFHPSIPFKSLSLIIPTSNPTPSNLYPIRSHYFLLAWIFMRMGILVSLHHHTIIPIPYSIYHLPITNPF